MVCGTPTGALRNPSSGIIYLLNFQTVEAYGKNLIAIPVPSASPGWLAKCTGDPGVVSIVDHHHLNWFSCYKREARPVY
jgi:hypothetical protein